MNTISEILEFKILRLYTFFGAETTTDNTINVTYV